MGGNCHAFTGARAILITSEGKANAETLNAFASVMADMPYNRAATATEAKLAIPPMESDMNETCETAGIGAPRSDACTLQAKHADNCFYFGCLHAIEMLSLSTAPHLHT